MLRQWRDNLGRAFEAQALARADHAIDNGAIEQLAGVADQMPTEAVQPAPVMKVLEKSLDITAVADEHIMMHAVRPSDRLVGIGPKQPGASARPANPSGVREFGRDRQQRV